jgi:elongation factor 1-alpha
VALLDYEGEIREGDSVTIRCHFARVECRVRQLLDKVSRRTGTPIEDAPTLVTGADVANVVLVPLQPLCVEAFANYAALGR